MALSKILFLCLCYVAGVFSAGAQVYLINASFEGEPQDATVPTGWLPCERGTTPDILPGHWGVYTEASEGETFMGLITREDGSWESVCQRLSRSLETKECYTFTIDLAHSRTYAGYDGVIKLRIWGGLQKCGKNQLLLETGFIDHSDWETYEVSFTAKLPVNYLLLEAFYSEGSFSHRGNVLIDNISPIKKCIRASLEGD